MVNFNLPEANCYGFVIGKNKFLSLWDEVDPDKMFDEAYQFVSKQKELTTLESVAIQNEYIAATLAKCFCTKHKFKIIKVENSANVAEFPCGTVAFRISYNFFKGYDFHFAIKAQFDGELCWLHKPGKLPIDIMFDNDIIAEEWPGGYDTPTIFMAPMNGADINI